MNDNKEEQEQKNEESQEQQEEHMPPMRTSSRDDRPCLPARPSRDETSQPTTSTRDNIEESSAAPSLLLHETPRASAVASANAAPCRRSSSSRDGSFRKPPAPSSSTQEAIEHMAVAVANNTSSTTTANDAAVVTATASASSAAAVPGISSDTNNNNNSSGITSNSSSQRMRRLTTKEAALLEDAYSCIPTLEMMELPRGGISIATASVGRVQFGLPPETIKDSMRLGIEVPRVYIVPRERFCREMGPALGINLAEFEFPAYFNWFVRRKKCILVVDSQEAECDIRSVFEETLLGPSEFRNDEQPLAWNAGDFDASFPPEMRPDFYQEFKSFRIIPNSSDSNGKPQELSVDMLLDFCHFDDDSSEFKNACIGVPPELQPREAAAASDSDDDNDDDDDEKVGGNLLNSPPPPPRPPPQPLSGYKFASESVLNIGGGSTDTEDDDDDNDDSCNNNKNEPSRESSSRHGGESIRSKRRSSSLYSLRGFASRGGCMQDNTNNSADTDSNRGGGGSGGDRGRSGSTGSADATGGSQWVYSRVKWLGSVATVWPMNATSQEIKARSVPRCEIVCMPGGAEYFVHDVNADNVIVGKLRFSGTVRPPDENSVQGFLSSHTSSSSNDAPRHQQAATSSSSSSSMLTSSPSRSMPPPSFYPPSFGVTVLGNSHGFDANGSTSGYVLWINGRGVMVDPPPYSSATLELEGIRPQLIIGVIITHCHADHDAGAYQKVLTGSRVSLITAPSIYKSFIRKYAALSGLKPSLLRHSHRFRPAIIGQALRFQGATFHFTFSLHTIPCLAFKVEWREKSIVFTGDHLNHPTLMKEMEEAAILSEGRAEDLRRMPLQQCDVLLHEAGAPPVHTPLDVLRALPEEVKKRLYVVHTSNLPDDCGLRVAPTGTAGTIRLDNDSHDMLKTIKNNNSSDNRAARNRYSCLPMYHGKNGNSNINGDVAAAAATVAASFANSSDDPTTASTSTMTGISSSSATEVATARRPPLVLQRRADVSDAWFILNLLSNVPFFTSLSYVNTMEVLEIASVQVFGFGEIVLSAERRRHVLCVIWEGTCYEQEKGEDASSNHSTRRSVWHAGDWSGPKSLQPDVARSAEYQRDIVAVSDEGVKAIMLQMSALEDILRRGSKPYRKYLGPKEANGEGQIQSRLSLPDPCAVVSLSDHVLEVLKSNSVLRSLPALQKRMLESIAEGPRHFKARDCLWHIGDACENAFLIVSGTAVFGQPSKSPRVRSVTATSSRGNAAVASKRQSVSSTRRSSTPAGSVVEIMDGRFIEGDKAIREVPRDSEYGSLEMILEMRTARFEDDSEYSEESETTVANYDAQDRFANRLLARLYATRRYTSGLVFGRGCYLCDTSRMVSGDLVHNDGVGGGGDAPVDSSNSSLATAGADEPAHSSSVLAGPAGCVALVFPRTALVPFLDAHPGLLMSLQGTQVVV